jgi:lipopolysaccharide/colanic/teichoic acid biosynthesis glycosyltransferase
VASVAIVALAPLMLIIAVLVRLDSPGPVIRRQPRVGINRRRRRGLASKGRRRRVDRGGRIFMILTFRTTHAGAEPRQGWAAKNDPRVTKAGRFLRASRLDELPQLLNVLKGEMNIVGPRPEQPEIFAELRGELPSYHWRQHVLPGITGLAQVKVGCDESLDDVRRKIALDRDYIDRRSAFQDLAIMARTMLVMLLGSPFWKMDTVRTSSGRICPPGP